MANKMRKNSFTTGAQTKETLFPTEMLCWIFIRPRFVPEIYITVHTAVVNFEG